MVFAVVFCCCFSYRMRKVERSGCMKLMLVKTSENSYMIWGYRVRGSVYKGRGSGYNRRGGGGGEGLYSRWWGALIQGVPFLYEAYSCI